MSDEYDKKMDREEFERRFSRFSVIGFHLERDRWTGSYKNHRTFDLWNGWCAGRASLATPQEAPREPVSLFYLVPGGRVEIVAAPGSSISAVIFHQSEAIAASEQELASKGGAA